MVLWDPETESIGIWWLTSQWLAFWQAMMWGWPREADPSAATKNSPYSSFQVPGGARKECFLSTSHNVPMSVWKIRTLEMKWLEDRATRRSCGRYQQHPGRSAFHMSLLWRFLFWNIWHHHELIFVFILEWYLLSYQNLLKVYQTYFRFSLFMIRDRAFNIIYYGFGGFTSENLHQLISSVSYLQFKFVCC